MSTTQSDAVKKATTLQEHGFPVNTTDGSQVMATKTVDTDTGLAKIESEDGTVLEPSEDPMILQPAQTASASKAKSNK